MRKPDGADRERERAAWPAFALEVGVCPICATISYKAIGDLKVTIHVPSTTPAGDPPTLRVEAEVENLRASERKGYLALTIKPEVSAPGRLRVPGPSAFRLGPRESGRWTFDVEVPERAPRNVYFAQIASIYDCGADFAQRPLRIFRMS